MKTVQQFWKSGPLAKVFLLLGAGGALAGLCVVCAVCGIVLSSTPTSRTATQANAAPTPIPRPINTAPPSATPTLAATATATSSKVVAAPSSPTPVPIVQTGIINVPNVIGHRASDIEFTIGAAFNKDVVLSGEEANLPQGGELRDYKYKTYELFIFYDKALIAMSVGVDAGLVEEKTPLDRWYDFSYRVGLPIIGDPDLSFKQNLRWDNYQGYKIFIGGNADSGFIEYFKILKLR